MSFHCGHTLDWKFGQRFILIPKVIKWGVARKFYCGHWLCFWFELTFYKKTT